MSNRLAKCFGRLKEQKRSAFIPFIMGGDPDISKSTELLIALPDAGADIIELGIPFSDPMADGPVIQEAGKRALAAQTTLKNILEMARQFRDKHPDIPLILMGYYNPIYQYGLAGFASDAQSAGVDGLIIVDLPPEESGELTEHLDNTDIAMVQLVAPTSLGQRLATLLHNAKGYLYYVSVAGVTGSKDLNISQLKKDLTLLREYTDLPVSVGFGVKTPAQVAEIAPLCEGVIVGSAIVAQVAKHQNANSNDFVKAVTDFIKPLAGATNQR